MLEPLIDRPFVRPSREAVATATPRSLPVRIYRNFAAQDWIVGTYFVVLFFALAAGNGEGKADCYRMLAIDFGILAVGWVLGRGEILKGTLGSLVYRVSIMVPVVVSYFQLRWILPAVTTRALDASIYGFDMRVFGYEPSVEWDKFVTPTTTEWFAFFYFGYFFILLGHVLPLVLAKDDGPLLRHFALGIFLQFCITHVLYMVVPGWGPYHELKFEHELTGGTFWNLVVNSVHAGGALKDIFPSLHTGAPTFFAVFSFLNRDKKPFKYTWLPLSFCVSQIIMATMFLRWHYLVDIVAGFTLAVVNALVSRALVRWEEKRRIDRGVQPVFGDAPLTWLWRKLSAKKAA
jgi:hypothetical protein